MDKVKIGIVGCGAISGIYLKNLSEMFKEVSIIGVCDLIQERAEKASEEYKIPKIYKDMHEMFADKEVDIVLNLTRPYEHFDVTMAAIQSGKHVYSEKPLGATLEEGRKLVLAANEKGVLLGGAPDTYLGAGLQTCRKLIDDGFIGKPVGASAFMVCRGHETWHPDPAFYYKFGGGPMLDMGPYYLTALVNMLGEIDSVCGMTAISFPTRTITSEPHFGEIVNLDVPTNITGIMKFKSGVIGTIHTTFDAYTAEVPRIEIYGSEGTLSLPDPNTFGGPVRLYRPETGEFKEIPLLFDYKENSRGLGVADMAKAIQTNRGFRANHNQTLHVLETMTAFAKSSESNSFIKIESDYERMPPMKKTTIPGVIEF